MATQLKSLQKLCIPRKSVFDRSRKDVVFNISDLLSGEFAEDDARAFFEENYVTNGLRQLVEKTFDRLTSKKDQAATYLLSQAMGGGKTHSMIALGLLAKYPSLRKDFWKESELGTEEIRVIGFDGRESDYGFGVWGALAEQVGNKELFSELYTPLQAPGVTSWINLLKGPPTVILLDELPPYFVNAMSKSIGSSNLAAVTTTALSNLLVAANKKELQNVVIVISDLSSTMYTDQGTGVMTALGNLENETNRSAMIIEPVATQGDEVFHILRTRLFEKLPDISDIDNIAVAYAESVKKASQMQLTTASPESYASEIRQSYPFHFSLRDLYGRFKENPSFQQTRGLLRMMRSITANLWETEKAKTLYLIHPYDIDLNEGDIFTEFDRINPSLSEAVRIDIANNGHSHAEDLDVELQSTDATDAVKLLYVSSLSLASKAIVGLRDTELIAWLCMPGRDVSGLIKDVLEVLPNRAWYLHLSTDGRLFFKNVQNLAARLYRMVSSTTNENRVQELRKYLKGQFEPKIRDLYQEIKVLAPIDDIKITQDKVTLILTDPYSDALTDKPLNPEWVQFYEEQTFQNRILFLTGDHNTMDEVLKNAAYLRAVNVVIEEQEQEGMSPKDPQVKEAQRGRERYLVGLKSAVQQTFSIIVYPSRGKLRSEHINFNFDSNQFDAEKQIRKTLEENKKFSTEAANDTWVKKVEDRLFDGQKSVHWNEIKKRSAVKTEWQFHHTGLLEDIRDYAIKVGKWRPEGNMVRTGPFPKEPTSVTVHEKSKDADTGETILQIFPEGGDKVYYEIGETTPTKSSAVVDNYQNFRTTELKITFLCIDEGSGGRPTGKPFVWKNTITLKGKFYGHGKNRFFKLFSQPDVPLRYTTDGSDPIEHGIPYNDDFPVPKGCRIIMAVGEKDELRSKVETFNVDDAGEAKIDPAKQTKWNCQKRFSNLPPADGFHVMEKANEYGGSVSEVMINILSENQEETIFYTLSKGTYRTPHEVIDIATSLKNLIPESKNTISIGEIHFNEGQALLDWAQREKFQLDMEKEIQQ